ncbi:MAG: YdcF family protein [Bryobacterales bacterium]|nr:YdcF family protein [Bryobacterales bacterium]
MHPALLLTGAALLAVLTAGFVRVTAAIARQSSVDEARAADVIVVMGAAEYSGRPSPVLRARLDHALDLWRRDLAPRILTTGGAGGDPVFTEGEVGRTYLTQKGVPPEAVIVEPEGESTAHSALAVGELLRRMGLRSCIVVSDGYHIYRAKRLLESRGLKVYGSPRPEPVQEGWRRWRLYARQAAGYILWSVGVVI